MTTNGFKYAGSVSHGTLLSSDLVPRFLQLLNELDPAVAKAVEMAHEDDIKAALNNIGDPEPEGVGDLIDTLFNALDSYAPHGWYFGPHEGDGADFGFWQTEEHS